MVGALGAVARSGLIQLTKWTAPRPVTKRLRLAADGSVEKISTAAQLYEGKVEKLKCTVAAFLLTLKGIGQNDCLSYGVPRDDAATQVMSRKKMSQLGAQSGVMTRTDDAMNWPDGPATLMIDHDHHERRYTPEQLREALYEICPGLRQTGHIWAASASSCLFDACTKKEICGIDGQRIYIPINDGADIPRAADVLFKRTWLAGHGYIKISKAGSLLVRSILDASVFQPNRIDYCAPAICEAPLAQRKPPPKLHGNPKSVLDTRLALPDLSADEVSRYDQLVSEAKAQQQAAAASIRSSYMQDRVAAYIAKGMDPAAATRVMSAAMENRVLHADFVLTSEEGDPVTVGQLLADKAVWHGRRFADPVEPDYHKDRRVARAYLDGPGRPRIHSFAHGGCSYLLSHAAVTVQLGAGDRSEYMQKIASVFRERGTFYRRGGSLVAIDDDLKLEIQNEQLVLAAMDRSFRFEKTVVRNSTPTVVVADMPPAHARHFAHAFASHFSMLRAVATAPILNPTTGRVVDITGYDIETGVYVNVPEQWPGVPDMPSTHEVEQALRQLWWPVRLFPFAEPVDQTIMLTAMLTAVVRVNLPTAPGFAFDAPIQASGKTLLIRVLNALGGTSTAVSAKPDARGDEEMRKRLFALLLGGHGSVVIDNVVGEFDSPSLAAMLTNPDYCDRLLGESRAVSVPSTALVLLSGNNLILKGDLPRRILRCRIDPRSESPHQRAFDFDPVAVVLEHRPRLVAAALTILKAHLANPSKNRFGPGRTASFETWDDVVRQAVCRLVKLQAAGTIAIGGVDFPTLVDPMEAINNAVHQDPTRSLHGRLLAAWAADIGAGSVSNSVTVKRLVETASKSRPVSTQTNAGGVSAPNEPALSDVLIEIAGNSVTGSVNNKSLGKTMANYKDRVIEGRCLRQGNSYQGSATWWLDVPGGFGVSGGFLSKAENKTLSKAATPACGKKPTKLTKPTKRQSPRAAHSSQDKRLEATRPQ